MGTFFAELKRRHMYRVAAAYAVVAWVLLQIVNNLAPALRLPDWVATAVVVLLALGFPIALLFCWIQHLAPADSAAQQARTTRLDWALAGGLAAVVALLLYQEFAPNGAAPARPQTGIEAARSASASPAGAISIAVLPFANVSADAEQEFFSDGMTDEISGVLAKIPDLRVVGRTSAFQYKKRDNDLRAIGQALGATHLIEGSVRKAGNRVRITAQLVQADNGLQMWTENYDRELTDVFAIQEDIARAIAASLRMPLGLAQGEQLVSSRTTDVESYQQFLRARALYRSRAISDAIALLEPALVRDPTYAPSWALLGESYDFLPAYGGSASLPDETARPLVQSALEKAEMAAREAIRLDPKHANGYAALAYAQAMRRHWLEADDLFQKALALDANDTEILDVYSQMLLAGSGRLKEALRIREEIGTLEPFVPIYNTVTADIMRTNGDADAAIRILEQISPAGPAGNTRTYYLAQAYAAVGRYKEAADTLQTIRPADDVDAKAVQNIVRSLRTAPAKAAAPEALPDFATNTYFYTFVGAPERSLSDAERAVAVNYAHRVLLATLWDPVNVQLRKTEKYRAIVRNLGLVEYWRAKGWPEFCHPVGASDFACE